jgi:hypothetical protein
MSDSWECKLRSTWNINIIFIPNQSNLSQCIGRARRCYDRGGEDQDGWHGHEALQQICRDSMGARSDLGTRVFGRTDRVTQDYITLLISGSLKFALLLATGRATERPEF